MSTDTIISIVLPIVSIIIAVFSLLVSLYEPFKKFILRRCLNKISQSIYIYKMLNPCDLYSGKTDGEILLCICYNWYLQQAIPYANERLNRPEKWKELEDIFEYFFIEIYDKVSVCKLLFVTLSYWNLILKKLIIITKVLNQKEYIGKETFANDMTHITYGTKQKNWHRIESRLFLVASNKWWNMMSSWLWCVSETKKEKANLLELIAKKLRDNNYWNTRKYLKSKRFAISLSFEYSDIKFTGYEKEYTIIFDQNGECNSTDNVYFWYQNVDKYIDYLRFKGAYGCPQESKDFIEQNKKEILRSVNNINDFFFKKGKRLVVDERTLKISLE